MSVEPVSGSGGLAASSIVEGRTDDAERLLSADEPLASLQYSCGGEIPGTIAVPALLALVRKARAYDMRLARAIQAQDGDNAITAWAEVTPDAEGCSLVLSAWRASPLPPDEGAAIGLELASLVADAYVMLDARQCIQAVGSTSPGLAELGRAMTVGRGRPWTDFVTVEGSAHRQPLHWRLLDGVGVSVEGVAVPMRARLVPRPGPTGALAGLDLYLLPAALDALPVADPAASDREAEVPDELGEVLGRNLAPLLRQPIGRIVANAETIRARLAGPLADQYSEYAGDIAEAGRHLLRLVEDLGDLAEVENADFAIATEPVDLVEAANRVAGILGMRARERGISVERPDDSIQMWALGEDRRVLQILLNLLGNALHYGPADSTVRLVLGVDGGFAEVTVTDEGAGLAEEQIDRVFAKFERLGRSGDGGSGLGLYISRRLARAMGGDIVVRSPPGKGAEFTLRLPQARSPSDGAAAPQP
ncbi:sensor histidine kinase [Novosphingobium tardum]|uniref:histidine kinase n=1 Tax=Novosphingobium tardum TaxID=1538021 RepID=A0ABV8RQE4_9SPHN